MYCTEYVQVILIRSFQVFSVRLGDKRGKRRGCDCAPPGDLEIKLLVSGTKKGDSHLIIARYDPPI